MITTFGIDELEQQDKTAADAARHDGWTVFSWFGGELFGCEAFDEEVQEAHPWWYQWTGSEWVEAP